MGIRTKNIDQTKEYNEVAVKPAVYLTIIIIGVVALPLVWLNLSISKEGSMIADTSRYHAIVETVLSDVNVVQSFLDSSHMDEKALKYALAPVPRLITPDILPTDMNEANMQDRSSLKISLNAIYWSPTEPIVTINDENYHVGEKIQGYRIVEIRKTEVVFENPMGDKVVKYFYEYLGEADNKR